VLATVLTAGIAIPVLIALPPLVRGTRRTVREAIDDHGGDPAGRVGRLGARLGRLPGLGRAQAMAARSMLRRPGRLALTVGLLAVAGATFVTGLNTAAGWTALAEAGVSNRHYDLEIRLAENASPERLVTLARSVPGVRDAEAWGRASTAVSVPGRIDVAHVYPDDGHGSFTMMAPPADTRLITLPVRSGRWLRTGDTDAVVLNTTVVSQQAPQAIVGGTVVLSLAGRPTRWRVVGIVSDFGTQGAAYVSDTAFAAATAQATGSPGGAGMLRVSTDTTTAGDRATVLRRLTAALDADGVQVEQILTTDDLRSALNGHVFVLVEALVAIALVIGVVAVLGLATALSTSVTERTREFGIMHAIGATEAAVRAVVVTEGMLTGLAGLIIAAVASLPMSAAFGSYLGRTAFGQALPLTVGPAPLLLWTVLTLAGAAVATTAAARRASRMTVREALDIL
jgi:putative ABC transport system permease protein